MVNSAKKELFDRIINIYPDLSPKKKRIADLIINDYKKLFLMKAKEIAKECGVSEPTVTRFILDLGFSGYDEFEQYIKGLFHIELTSVERILKSSRKAEKMTPLKAFYQNTLHNLENLIHTISDQEIKALARKIHHSKSVLVAGYRASSVLASYFGFLLKKIRPGVLLDTRLSWDILDHIALHGSSLLLFVIAFPRYPTQAIELIEYAKKYNVHVIGLSDTLKSPIIGLSDEYLIVDMEGFSFVDPFAHIITLLGALIYEISFLDKDATLKRLTLIEEGLKKRKTFFSTDEIPPVDTNPLEVKYYIPEKSVSSVGEKKEKK